MPNPLRALIGLGSKWDDYYAPPQRGLELESGATAASRGYDLPGEVDDPEAQAALFERDFRLQDAKQEAQRRRELAEEARRLEFSTIDPLRVTEGGFQGFVKADGTIGFAPSGGTAQGRLGSQDFGTAPRSLGIPEGIDTGGGQTRELDLGVLGKTTLPQQEAPNLRSVIEGLDKGQPPEDLRQSIEKSLARLREQREQQLEELDAIRSQLRKGGSLSLSETRRGLTRKREEQVEKEAQGFLDRMSKIAEKAAQLEEKDPKLAQRYRQEQLGFLRSSMSDAVKRRLNIQDEPLGKPEGEKATPDTSVLSAPLQGLADELGLTDPKVFKKGLRAAGEEIRKRIAKKLESTTASGILGAAKDEIVRRIAQAVASKAKDNKGFVPAMELLAGLLGIQSTKPPQPLKASETLALDEGLSPEERERALDEMQAQLDLGR